MQTSFGSRVGLSLILLALSACTSHPNSETSAASDSGRSTSTALSSDRSETPASFSEKMQRLSAALNQLLPLISDTRKFNDPANDKVILDSATRLKVLSHQVKGAAKPGADPAYDSIAYMLDDDLTRAISALNTGNRDYARMTLRESMGYCIQCHTQKAGGPEFARLELGLNPAELQPLNRADYFAATRQFDQAIQQYLSIVLDRKFLTRDLFGWEKATRSALALAVRFKQSPDLAQQVADAVLKNSAAPPSLVVSAKRWKKAIAAWRSEPKSTKSLLIQAESLLKRAMPAPKDADEKSLAPELTFGDMERGSEIEILRASGDLHAWLEQSKGDQNLVGQRAKALFLAGLAAEASKELNFWTLHERYFEMCIQGQPKSSTARACYDRLAESVTLGYTGSSGTHLPEDETERLARLKAIAFE